jgi:hypothetical protein
MNRKARMLWLISGLAIACAATTTMAAQKGGKAVKQHLPTTKGQFVTSPRTMAQADATQIRLANGASAMKLPTELWSHLAVQKDAQGNLHQVETSSDVAPTAIVEGAGNE